MSDGPFGVDLHSLDPAFATSLVEAWCGDAPVHADAGDALRRCGTGVVWLLGHCDDGVVWGRWRPADAAVFWAVPPVERRGAGTRPVPGRVQQLRAFGASGEILCWRDEDARDSFAGRQAIDGAAAEWPYAAMDQTYVLAANRLVEALADDCSLVGNPQGCHQVVPLALAAEQFRDPTGPADTTRSRYGLVLDVRHYFVRDGHSGAVRRGVTRLVNVRPLPADEQTVEEKA